MGRCREALVEKALMHVFGDTGSGPATKAPFASIFLAVMGGSGSGNTALMAHVASQVYLRQRESTDAELRSRSVISRYSGTSAHSFTGTNLVRSICRQIHFSLGHDMSKCQNVLSMTYGDAVQSFVPLLRENAVALFVDSLDQVSDDDLARSKITFLQDLTLHKHSRVIVSALPDERNTDTGKWKYMYGCESRLTEAAVPPVLVPKVDTSSSASGENEARTILSHLLSLRRRRLSSEQ